MRECPILFSPWSVQRILANGKSQTRRVINPQPIWDETPGVDSEGCFCGRYQTLVMGRNGEPEVDVEVDRHCCPHGAVGDRLYVKEPFSLGKAQDGRTPAEAWEHVKETNQGLTVLYCAGGWKSVAPFERQEMVYKDDEPMPEWAGRRRHGMFMPRWASLITLEITNIRVQRVQQISEEDAIAEGREATGYTEKDIEDIKISDASPDIKELAKILGPGRFTAKGRYMTVWDEINGKTHPWSSDPYVWAISFRRLEPQ